MLPERNDDEVSEEDELVSDELCAHPTRDDWHEQREYGQAYEAMIHARVLRVTLVTVSRRVGAGPR